jgi:hypothetical protein
MEAYYLIGEFGFKKPTKVMRVREITHFLPSWNNHGCTVAYLLPERFKYCWIPTAYLAILVSNVNFKLYRMLYIKKYRSVKKYESI